MMAKGVEKRILGENKVSAQLSQLPHVPWGSSDLGAPELPQGSSKPGWRQQLRSHRVGRADSEFQGRAFLALTEMSPSTEAIDLLLPLASSPCPDLSPRQQCCVQQDVITSLILPRAAEQLGSSSAQLPQQPKTSHQLGFAAEAPQALVLGSALLCWQHQSKTSSWLAPSSTSAQPSRAARAGTRDAKCHRGSQGTAQVLGLGSNSCRICQQGHLPISSSGSPNPCPAPGQPGYNSALLQHPGDTTGTQGPHHPGEHGACKEGSEPGVEVKPTSV